MYNLKLKYKLVFIAVLFLIFSYLILFLTFNINKIINKNKVFEYRIELKSDSLYDSYKKYSFKDIKFNDFLKNNLNLKQDREEEINNIAKKYNLNIIDKGYITQNYLKAFITNEEKDKILKDENILNISKEIYRKKADTPNTNRLYNNINTGIIEFQKNNHTNEIAPLVAVIDTGIEINHIAFKKAPSIKTKINGQDYFNDIIGLNLKRPKFKNKKIPLYYNYLTDKNATQPIQDHGLHVAGIIGADYTNNYGQKFQGVEPDAQIIAFNVFTQTGASDTHTIKAIEDAILLGVDVINMSLGGPTGELDQEDKFYSYGFTKALKAAYEANIHVVIAAGNSGLQKILNNKNNSSHKDFVDQQTLYAPGTSKYAFTVGASNKEYTKIADFSSRGITQDLDLKPEIVAPGHLIYSLTTNSQFKFESGTSMASPNTAGAISRSLKMFKDLNIDFSHQQAFIMSRSGLLRDINNVPYSPRYQGAGYIKLESLLNPKGYFYNQDKQNKAKFTLEKNENSYSFNLKFKALETKTYLLSSSLQTILYNDKEQILPDLFKQLSSKVEYYINSQKYEEYEFIKDNVYDILAKINLNEDDLNYLNNFKYGTFLEGFVIFKDKLIEEDPNLTQNQKQDNYIHAPFIGFSKNYDLSPVFKSTTLNDLNYYSKYTDISYYQPKLELENQKLNTEFILGSIENINNLDIKRAYIKLGKSINFNDRKLKAYIDDLSNHYVLDDLALNTYSINRIYFPVYKNITDEPVISFYNNEVIANSKIHDISKKDYNQDFTIYGADKIKNARYIFSHDYIASNKTGVELESASYILNSTTKRYFNNKFNNKKIIMRFNTLLEKTGKDLEISEDFEIYIDRQNPEIINISEIDNNININYNEDTIPLGVLIYTKDGRKIFNFIKDENINNINKNYILNKDIPKEEIKAIQIYDYLGKFSKAVSLTNTDVTSEIDDIKEKDINVYVKNSTNNYELHKTIKYYSNQDKNIIFNNYLSQLEELARQNFKTIYIYKDNTEQNRFIKNKDKVIQDNYYIEFKDAIFNFNLILKKEGQYRNEMEDDQFYFGFRQYYLNNRKNFELESITFTQLMDFLNNIDKRIPFFNYYYTTHFYSHRMDGAVEYNHLLDIAKELYLYNPDVYNPYSLTLKPIMSLKDFYLIDPLKNQTVTFNKESNLSNLRLDYNNLEGIYYKGNKVNDIIELLENVNQNRQVYIDLRYINDETETKKNINIYLVKNGKKTLYNTLFINLSLKNEYIKNYIEKDTSIINNLENRIYYLDENLTIPYSFDNDNNTYLNYYFKASDDSKKNINIYRINSDNSITLEETFVQNLDTKIEDIYNYITEKIENKKQEGIRRVYYLNREKAVYDKNNDSLNYTNYYYQDKIDVKYYEFDQDNNSNRLIKRETLILDEKLERVKAYLTELTNNRQKIGYELSIYLDNRYTIEYNTYNDKINQNEYYIIIKRPKFIINDKEYDYIFDIDTFVEKHYKVESVNISIDNLTDKTLIYRDNILIYIHNKYKNSGIKIFNIEVNTTSLKEYRLIDENNPNNYLIFNKETDFSTLKFEKEGKKYLHFTHNGIIVDNIQYLLDNIENEQIIVNVIYEDAREYTIYIYENNNIIDRLTVLENTQIENLTKYSKKGYNLIGFYKEIELENEYQFPISVNKDLNLYIRYEAKKYIINIDFEGKNITYNLEYNKHYEFKLLEGYNLVYFINGAKIDYKGIWTYDSVKLTYKKTHIFYELKIDFNGANSNKEPIYSFTAETNSFTIKQPYKIGYEFIGFSEEGKDGLIKEYVVKKGTKRDIKLKANFKIIIYKISYTSNYQNLINQDFIKKYNLVTTYTIKDLIIFPKIDIKGYKFISWKTTINGIGKEIKEINLSTNEKDFIPQDLKIELILEKEENIIYYILAIVGSIFIILIISISVFIIIRKSK